MPMLVGRLWVSDLLGWCVQIMVVGLDDEDRKLLIETKLKLDEAAKLMTELMETIEVLSDAGMMKAIREGQEDVKAGRVKELRRVLKEEVS